MIKLNLPEYHLKTKDENGKKLIFDRLRKKYITLTPEEWVRQNFIEYLIQEKNYPPALISVEKKINFGKKTGRWDIVVFNRQGEAFMLIECKAPEVKLSQQTIDQAALYNSELKVRYLLITNGLQHFCCEINYSDKTFVFLKELPNTF